MSKQTKKSSQNGSKRLLEYICPECGLTVSVPKDSICRHCGQTMVRNSKWRKKYD